MSFYFRCLLAAASSAVFTSSAIAAKFPEPKVEYRASLLMTVEGDGMNQTMRGTVYGAKQKERREFQVEGMPGALIHRRDKDVVWVLVPSSRTYMERDTPEKKAPGEDWYDADEIEMKKIGTETVNGFDTTKYEVTVSTGEGTASEGVLWLTEHDIPIKMEGTVSSPEGPVRFKTEYTNLEIGPQDPKLFELPEGYTKFELPQIPGLQPGMPSGGPPQGMSEEQLQEMQKKMQEQMKKMQEQMSR